MSDLSRSLVDAAAVAIVTSIGYEARHAVDFEDEGRAAVAAVLETLADAATHFNGSVTLHKHQREAIRRLAAEVKEERP